MSSARELHQRGVAANNAGRYGEARRLLSRALALAEDAETAALVEVSLAHLEAETGDGAVALARCDRLLGSAPTGRTKAMVHGQRGMLLMLAGRLTDALPDFSEAIAGLVDTPDQLGRVLQNRGNLHLRLQEVVAAEADFSAAVPELERAGNEVEAAMARHNLGYCRFLAGDLVEALRLMDRAAPTLAPLSPVSRAVGQQDRAEVLMAAGMVAAGRGALRTAAITYGSRRLRRHQAEAELALAKASLLTEPAAAREAARSAVRHFKAASAPSMAARAEAVGLAASVRLGERGRALLSRADETEATLRADGARWDAVTVALHRALMLLARGEVDDAGATLARVRAGARAPLAVRLLEREVRAELACARGRRSAALGQLRSGLADLHAWQSSFGSLDLQTMVVGHGTRLGVRGLELAIDSGRCEVLFEWSERARMLASRIQPVRAPQDEQTAADLAELRAGPAPAREAELRRQVRERAWQRRGSGVVTDPVTLERLQGALDEATALVAYVAAAGRLVALVVTDTDVSRHELGDRSALDSVLGGLLPDLDVAAGTLPAPVAAAVRGNLADRIARLDATLVDPLADAIGDRRLVLTPSGVLAGVPWTLLPGLAGRPVEVSRSATAWAARRRTAAPQANSSPIAAEDDKYACGATPPGSRAPQAYLSRTGGPDDKNACEAAPTTLARAGFVAGPRVARAEAEVTAAATRWPDPVVLVGEDATAAAVSAMAARVDVLHVAAHGRHAADNPLFSGVELVDGPWSGYDVEQLAAVPQVVLLSACELGRSTIRHGEELVGATSAWLHAGARWVVAATAAVNDAVAHDALLTIHAGLAEGLDPAAALAAVKNVPGEAPAPFVCFS